MGDWLDLLGEFGGKYADYDIAKRTVNAQTEAQIAAYNRQVSSGQQAYQANAQTLSAYMPVILIVVVGVLLLKA